MSKINFSGILQLPLLFIMVASFFGSVYAVVKKIGGIGIAAPIIIGGAIISYFYGRYLENKLVKGGR